MANKKKGKVCAEKEEDPFKDRTQADEDRDWRQVRAEHPDNLKGPSMTGYICLERALREVWGYDKLSKKNKKVFDTAFNKVPVDEKELVKHIKKINSPAQAQRILQRAKEIRKERRKEDKSFDKKEEQKKRLSKFIFDENKVIRNKIFPFLKLNDDLAGFGIFLPKDKEIYDKQGKYKGTEQVLYPVIIGSDRNLYEIGEELEKEYKIKIRDIPDAENYGRRWSLGSIKEYLDGSVRPFNGLAMFKQICDIYKSYMYFSNDFWYKIHALWDLGTYFFLLSEYYPLLELRGHHGTAKSKVMTISRLTSFNASEEMTNPSEATLFRDTHEKRHTKYIDEAEKLYFINQGRVEADPRAELINSGYKYTGTVPRQEKVLNKFKTVYYHTYSPTMVASINGLYGATEDRAIIHITVKAHKDDKRGGAEPKERNPLYQEIRDKCYIFALENWKRIEKAYHKFNMETDLINRDLNLWKLLFILAAEIDKDLLIEIKEFAEKLTKIKGIDSIPEGSTDYKIIQIVHEMLNEGKIPILIKEINDRYPGDYKYRPSNKTIAKNLDRLGFMEYKAHFESGNGYDINKELFKKIVSNAYPAIFASFASDSSGKKQFADGKLVVEEEQVAEENLNYPEGKNPEGNEANEANEANMKKQGLKTNFLTDDILKTIQKTAGINGKVIPIQELIQKYKKKGIEDFEIDNVLVYLKAQGDIFEPKKGYIQIS